MGSARLGGGEGLQAGWLSGGAEHDKAGGGGRLATKATAMDGFRIAVVSDIHLGPLRGRAHTERIVSMINATEPDLVAVVGDLVDGTVAELGSAAQPLQDLVSREGTFFGELRDAHDSSMCRG